MSFIIQCPHCHQEITEKDFEKSHQAVSYLQQFFNRKEQEYCDKLKNQLDADFQKQKAIEITSVVNEKENEWNKQHDNELHKIKETHQQILDGLNQQLNDAKSNLKSQEKTKEADIKVILGEKEKEWSKLQQNKLDTLNKDYQKNINDLKEKNHQLDMLVKTNDAKVQELVAKKETEIINSKQEEINKLIDERNKLMLKWEQGRNIRPAISGANLENDFAGKMPSFFPNDHFEKTTKAINGNKPDFRLGVLNDEEENNKVVGNILFELKNQEKLDSKWEEKLAIELKDWKARFGIIVWAYAKAPFSRSSKCRDIFIINTDLEVIALIVNILKILIKKEFALSLQFSTNKNDQEFKERFNNWLQDEFSSLIGKAMQEFIKFEKHIQQIQNSNEKLKSVKENLQEILIAKIEDSLKKLL